jgi:TonB family protein
MTPRPSQAPGAFETPRLAVHWQGRRANFLESLHAALRGPRPARDFDPGKSFFRLRVAPGRAPGRGIAGSFLWHVLLLSISIPLSRLATPKPHVALPQIEITWYGPTTDIAPTTAPKPKKPKPALKPKPKPRPKPRRVVVARAYNPKTTVIYNPPHANSRRQVLIEPDAPPEMPKSMLAMPNVIRWAVEAPVRPSIAAQIFARQRRNASAEAMLQAPEIRAGTPPAGPLDIAPSANPTLKPPLTIAPSAIHAVRSASPRAAAAPAPTLSGAAPAAGPLALDTGPSVTIAPPQTSSAIRARRKANATRSAAAPKVEVAAHRIVALSLSPGNAPPPPGNAAAPISIGPHVARKVSTAAPDLAANAASGAGIPGAASASAATRGPEGLVILHNSSAPAPPPPPKPASALPKIARIAPKPVRSAIPPRPTHSTGSASRMVKHNLAHRLLGPWRIHTLLMNMPNLTSSSGSWVLNFADPLPIRLRKDKNLIAPLPVHTVDPEYPPELKQEGVEGKVVLLAVIDRDGTVSKIRVVKSLDPVLDHNAKVAFSEWKFEPALINDQPIDLRVIVTVPFQYKETQ